MENDQPLSDTHFELGNTPEVVELARGRKRISADFWLIRPFRLISLRRSTKLQTDKQIVHLDASNSEDPCISLVVPWPFALVELGVEFRLF